jgi:uncharacterized protein (TIGR00304 family)
LIILIVGIVVLGYSTTTGDTEVVWFLIIPMIIGHGILSFIGTILILLAIFVGMYALIQGGNWVLADDDDLDELFGRRKRSGHEQRPPSRPDQSGTPEPRPRSSVKGGGVVLVGPIPIIFGSDKQSATVLSILAIIIMIIALIAIFGGYLFLS